MVPIWRSTPPDTWINTGLAFWVFVTTGPLTLSILVGIALAWHPIDPVRRWWLAALALAALERVATFAYFIPTMAWLQGQAGDAAIAPVLDTWVLVNHGRHLLAICAWLLVLKALSLLDLGRVTPAPARA